MPNRDPKLHPRLPKDIPVEKEESTGIGLSRADAAALQSLEESTDLVPAFEHDDDESTALVSLESLGRIAHHEAKDRHLLVRVKGAGLGQVTRFRLRGAMENLPVDPSRFSFTPPKGVDVVEQP